MTRRDSNIPCYVKDFAIIIEFTGWTMWNAEEAEDPGFPTDATSERFFKQLSSVQTVKISGSTRLALSILSPLVTPSLTSLRSLNITSTFHTLSDPFNPSNYAGLRSCSQLAGLNLSVYHDSQAIPSLPQPPLESISFGSQLTFAQLMGPLSTSSNADSARRLVSAFGPLPIFSICDTTQPSSIIPDLLGALLAPENLRLLVLGIESRNEITLIGNLPNQLKAFSSLLALTLLSDFTSLSPNFFSTLHVLPIEYLKFETTSKVTLSQLFPLIEGPTKHPTLGTIILDHVKGKVGTRIEDAGKPDYNVETEDWDVYYDWTLPDWTQEFSEERLVEFIEVAKKEGVIVRGSAVDAIGIKAQRRAEWEVLDAYDLDVAEDEAVE
ncbi:hypothetical protein JCM5353_006460 [Sporobolomyces roseus]